LSGEKAGWRAFPGATDRRAHRLPPVEPGRVVGLGAICDLGVRRPDDRRDESFSVSEFVTLEDGRRVILHEERGFTTGLRSTGRSDPGDLREHETLESLERSVLNTVLPDDETSAEDHPWPWLADLARARGLSVTADDLRALSYEVVFTDAVRRWLASA
jgi:hypothetical protein